MSLIESMMVFSPAVENFVLYVPRTTSLVTIIEPGSEELHVTVKSFVSSMRMKSATFQSMITSWFCVSVTALVDASPVD